MNEKTTIGVVGGIVAAAVTAKIAYKKSPKFRKKVDKVIKHNAIKGIGTSVNNKFQSLRKKSGVFSKLADKCHKTARDIEKNTKHGEIIDASADKGDNTKPETA